MSDLFLATDVLARQDSGLCVSTKCCVLWLRFMTIYVVWNGGVEHWCILLMDDRSNTFVGADAVVQTVADSFIGELGREDLCF